MVTVASHQPQFLPWVGFWNKMAHADTFVLSSGIKFDPRDYTHRTVITNSVFLTLPITKETKSGLIKDVRYDQRSLLRIIQTLRMTYGGKKWPYRSRMDGVLSILDHARYDQGFLIDLNYRLLAEIRDRIGLTTWLEGDEEADGSTKMERLFNRVNRHHKPPYVYLMGEGAYKGYFNKDELPKGVVIKRQTLDHNVPGSTILEWLVSKWDIKEAVIKGGCWTEIT